MHDAIIVGGFEEPNTAEGDTTARIAATKCELGRENGGLRLARALGRRRSQERGCFMSSGSFMFAGLGGSPPLQVAQA
jgi:hypothetical protein